MGGGCDRKRKTMIKNLLVAAQLIMLCQMTAAWADDEPNVNIEIPGQDDTPLKTVTSMDAYNETNGHTADSFAMAAEYAYNNGDTKKALKLCEKALNSDNNDIDIHKIYAQALEEQIKNTGDKNHDLLNKCVREWLIVYRTEVGDEKGISYHGIDPFGYLYRDEDRSMLAGSHLVSLTGRVPKIWETDDKYLKWVNRPTTAVAGRILEKPAEKKVDQ
jgi:hypothetical protein